MLSHLSALRCHRSDQQPAGHPNDPGGCHQGPGQRAEPAEGQSAEDGGREGVAAEPVPGPGRETETAAPVPGEGVCLCISVCESLTMAPSTCHLASYFYCSGSKNIIV